MQLGSLYIYPGDLLVVAIVLLTCLAFYFFAKALNSARDEAYADGYEQGYQDAVLDGLHSEDGRKAA